MTETSRHNGHARPNGVRGTAAATPLPLQLDIERMLAGRRILLTGATGFLGKVTLSMLLHRYPGVEKVYVLVRPGTGGTAEARFFGKVVPSRPFDPLRKQHGAAFEGFVQKRCEPIAGDLSDPRLGLSPGDLDRLSGLDLVVNCAGLVDFNPSLEIALHVNAVGPQHAVELCRATGAALVHVSTCFVAGNRDGVVFEDEEIRGYFPRREGVVGRPKESTLDAADFDWQAEIADCERRIAAVREAAEDRLRLSEFRQRAAERLRAEGRRNDEKALRLAIGREKRVWVSQRLVDLGMERARHWGWQNTYCFTKALGEQAVAAGGVPYAIVRPSIVESAIRYPFPGWNEGFTTSAPLAFLGLKGHRSFPAAEKAVLDVVPVDLVSAGILAASAETLERAAAHAAGSPSPQCVYHLASGDVNPLWVRRSIELTGLYRRRFYRTRDEGNPALNKLLSRFEPYSVSRSAYQAFSSPTFAALARAAGRLVREHAPRWGAPRLSAFAAGLAGDLEEFEARLAKTEALWDLYLPFVTDNKYVFRCARIRELYARLRPRDRERIPWDPERIDWRSYWLDVHMKGMEEWVFPGLEEEAKKKLHPVKPHRDLLELLQAAVENHRHRTALRMSGQPKERFTYGELGAFSERAARFLVAAGVRRGDRVLLASENRPEWAIAYFGILRAGAAAVPVDPQLTGPEMANLARTAGARMVLLSERIADRLPDLGERLREASVDARVALLPEALAGGPPVDLPRSVSPEDLASLIFTSGTTGTPKGVMLTHRNFASLVAKLAAVFDIGPGDGLLSVLPLHHTFEFACGLLVPLARGAEVEYLDEITSEAISEALDGGRVTAMIGVPALWSLLHRRITQELAAKPGFVEEAFQALGKLNASLRDRASINLGKLLFWPVHRRMGGRLRILVSGGSALSPEVQKAFHEMGFDLYEGYGLTEASPVLAVSAPGNESAAGSVGKPIPGVEIRIDSPDATGVGEVLARGPNVMLGYWRGGDQPGIDRDATDAAVEDGWLRTGDLGMLDADGNLRLVGRKKDVIIEASGKNVYPDEIEELYAEPDLVKELSVVGLPDAGGGERVAMLVVPDYRGRNRAEVRERIDAHVRRVSTALPYTKRAKLWHVADVELPRTSTRKVKRQWVVEELQRLEIAAQKGRKAREARSAGDGWLLDLVAEVSRRPRSEITHQTRLATDLAFDSLMLTELTAALEEAGVPVQLAEELAHVQTVGELSRLVGAGRRHAEMPGGEARGEPAPASEEAEIPVPAPIAMLGRRVLGVGQRVLYRTVYATRVVGEAYIPRDRNFLVVANHASHLDMGLIKVALGDAGEKLAALAARDYFFDTRVKRAYFENFTNLIPMERSGALKRSLRAATEALRRGYNLLIFPEGTRSVDGRMAEFKATAGYLALHCEVDTIPLYVKGTHEALPKGSILPRRADLEVRIGAPISFEELRRRTEALPRGEAYRAATRTMEQAVRALGGEPPLTSDGATEAREATPTTSPPTPTPTPTPTPNPTATATPPAPTPPTYSVRPQRRTRDASPKSSGEDAATEPKSLSARGKDDP